MGKVPLLESSRVRPEKTTSFWVLSQHEHIRAGPKFVPFFIVPQPCLLEMRETGLAPLGTISK